MRLKIPVRRRPQQQCQARQCQEQGNNRQLRLSRIDVLFDRISNPLVLNGGRSIGCLRWRRRRQRLPVALQALIEQDSRNQETCRGENRPKHVQNSLRAAGEHEEQRGQERANINQDVALNVSEPGPVAAKVAAHIVGQSLIHQTGIDEMRQIKHDAHSNEKRQRVQSPADEIGEQAKFFRTSAKTARGRILQWIGLRR